ncbi:MAG: hypothetical protein ACMG57_05265 [Candidatus Dojkabacteria bacterium]
MSSRSWVSLAIEQMNVTEEGAEFSSVVDGMPQESTLDTLPKELRYTVAGILVLCRITAKGFEIQIGNDTYVMDENSETYFQNLVGAVSKYNESCSNDFDALQVIATYENELKDFKVSEG